MRVTNWLTPWDETETMDAGLIGAPYSGTWINSSAAYGDLEACVTEALVIARDGVDVV